MQPNHAGLTARPKDPTMASMLKSLLGNGSNDRELTEELRAVLHEMQQERGRCEKLIEGARASADQLRQLGEPIAKAETDVDAVAARLADLEQRLEAMVRLSTVFENLAERADGLTQSHERAEAQIAETLEHSQHIRSVMEEFSQKVDLAVSLKDQLVAFLEIEKPFSQLRGEADTLRGQVEGTGENLARLGQQHDRLLDAHKLATSKMEALDRRRDDLGRSLQDKERRINSVEQAVREMDGVQHTVDEARREVGVLKATADLV